MFKKNGILTIEKIPISCKELIERFINSVAVIANIRETYDSIKIGIIFHKNGTLSFSHLNVKYLLSLDEIQITLYSMMVNFFSNIQIYSATNDQNVKSINESIHFGGQL